MENIIVLIVDKIPKFLYKSEWGSKNGVTNVTLIVDDKTVINKNILKHRLSTICFAIFLIILFWEK